MKLKENKGVSLTGFAITILVILLVVAVAGCVYLLNNPVKEKVAVQNPAPVTGLNSSSEVKENTSSSEDNSKLLQLLKVSLDNYIHNLEGLRKFTTISQSNLEEIVNFSLYDADYAYYTDGKGWRLVSDDKENIVKEVTKRFDISDSSIKEKIKALKIDAETVGMYKYTEGGDASYIDRNYSKIENIKYLGNNQYEITATQFYISVQSNTGNDNSYIEEITISSGDVTKEVYSILHKNNEKEETNNYEKYMSDIVKYAKENNIGKKIFTIEINDNYNDNVAEEYGNDHYAKQNTNSYIRLISIK